MEEEEVITPEESPPTDPPFFTITIVDGKYELKTNLGEYWQWHLLLLAKQVKDAVT